MRYENLSIKSTDNTDNCTQLKFYRDHKGTYCVWELGDVWHEQNVWVLFLDSKWDEEAKLR